MRVLIDSSAWVHALRKDGNEKIRLAVKNCLNDGSACLCEPVLLELWNGARGAMERRMLAEFQSVLEIVPTTDQVWSRSYQIASHARAKGITVPAIDILIFSIASEQELSLLHDDDHFTRLMKLAS